MDAKSTLITCLKEGRITEDEFKKIYDQICTLESNVAQLTPIYPVYPFQQDWIINPVSPTYDFPTITCRN